MYSFCLSLFLSKWESMTETQQVCVARESNFLGKLKLTSGHSIQMISGVWSASFPPFDDANLANLHHTVDSRDLNSGNKTRLWKTQDLYHYYLIIRWQSNIGPGSNSSSFIASKGYYFNTGCPALVQVINTWTRCFLRLSLVSFTLRKSVSMPMFFLFLSFPFLFCEVETWFLLSEVDYFKRKSLQIEDYEQRPSSRFSRTNQASCGQR